jgi:serralysin
MSASLSKTDNNITNLIEDNVFLRGLATRYFLNTPISFETWDNLELTYQFRKTEQSPEHSTTIRWNENIGSAAQRVFSQIETISNLRFTEVSENADIDFWLYFENNNTLGYSYGIEGPGIFINSFNIENADIPSGGMDHLTIAHEIMHNLGMTHPFDGYANFPGVNSTYDLGELNSSQNIYTVTSYNDTGTTTADALQINPDNFEQLEEFGLSNIGVIDQLFLQTLYGTNDQTNSDDTIFFFDLDDRSQNWETIWDTSGNDTVAFQGEQTYSVHIDLRSPTLDLSDTDTTFSGICTVTTDNTWGGFIIGHGVNIENALSGLGNDNLTGNNLDNFLQSIGGDNIFKPSLGNDLIKSGDGEDIIYLQSNEQWSDEFVALHTITNVTSTYEQINLAGYNKFTDHIFSGDGEDKIYLTAENDAFFLDDHYSASHSSIYSESSEFGLPFGVLPRLMACEEIYGMGGSDILDFTSPKVSASKLLLDGGDGDDILWSGAQNDVLIGGNGNDILNGGPGDDFISGGLGEDQFKFVGLFGNDTITDWENGVDNLLLYNIKASDINFNQNSILYGSENSIIFSNLSEEEVLSISIDFI